MKGVKNSSSINPTLILIGLWFINTLIVIFGLPFLIYKKVREICSDNSKLSQQDSIKKSKSKYLPRLIDSKLS